MRKFRRVKRDKKTNVPSKYLAGAKNKAAKQKRSKKQPKNTKEANILI